jgi:hypothetical protein
MTCRLLLLDLDPAAAPRPPRAAPWLLLPLPDHRAAIALADETAEEVLAALLADGMAIRSSRVIDSARG